MFLPFFASLRRHGVPVSPTEYLAFLDAVAAGVAGFDVAAFHHLGRATLVKDERRIDRFDRAFAECFAGVEHLTDDTVLRAFDLPADWFDRQIARHLTEAEKAEVAALGGFEALMQTLRDRLAEQTGRHQGGSKWIGTGGTSSFGAAGYNPEGIRIGQDGGRQGRAVKVWDRRDFRGFDDDETLGPRAIRIALRRLRRWAREGAAQELDLPGTIRATSEQGWLDVRLRPERRNAARVILLLDIGGSMDPHADQVQALFSAARSEFAHLRILYFHNCPYDHLWTDARRRPQDRVATDSVLGSHGAGWTAILVGDAHMSPYELTHPGGASEHWNAEAGQVWLARLLTHWPRHLWINPMPEAVWDHGASIRIVRGLTGPDRMVPLTLDGLTRGLAVLR